MPLAGLVFQYTMRLDNRQKLAEGTHRGLYGRLFPKRLGFGAGTEQPGLSCSGQHLRDNPQGLKLAFTILECIGELDYMGSSPLVGFSYG